MIARAKSSEAHIAAYERFLQAFEDLKNWTMLPFDAAAAAVFERLRSARLGVSTIDLRIASIVLAHNATLLSRNLRDFERAPDLKLENWLE